MSSGSVFQKKLLKALEKIVGFYEKANYIMSLMTLRYVRRESIKRFLEEIGRNQRTLLDAGCGPGVMSIYLLSYINYKEAPYIVGMDPLEKMLIEYKRNLSFINSKIDCVRGVFENPPFRNGAFNSVIVAFAIRDSINILKAVYELYNTLSHRGCLCILELGKPLSRVLFREALKLYFKIIPALIGAVTNGLRGIKSYSILGETYDKYPFTPKLYMFIKRISRKCSGYYMLGGAVSLLVACKS